MSKVTESVPLRTALGVHVIQIIICDTLVQCLDLMLEYLATKRRLVGNIKRQTNSKISSSSVL